MLCATMFDYSPISNYDIIIIFLRSIHASDAINKTLALSVLSIVLSIIKKGL